MATTIGPEDPAFVGFVPVSLRPFPTGSYFTCPTSAFYTASASYQGCCYPDTKCVIATACEDNTLQFGGSSVTWYVARYPAPVSLSMSFGCISIIYPISWGVLHIWNSMLMTEQKQYWDSFVQPTGGRPDEWSDADGVLLRRRYPVRTHPVPSRPGQCHRRMYEESLLSPYRGAILTAYIAAPESTETSAGASVPSGQSSSTSTSSSSSAGAKPSGSASKSAPASDATYGEAPGTPPAKSPSKAWIAGAVIGPLAFVALAGLGIMLFRRRRRAAAAAAAAQTNLASSPGDQKDAGFYYKPPAAYDQRASSAAWGPDSGFYKPVPAPPAETAYEGAHELAGDRSTQVFIELPAYGQGQGESPVELPAHSHDQHGK